MPVGGHKGYGMVLVHEMLTAVLTGGKWTSRIKSLYEEDESGVQGTCHSFLAVDPDRFIGRDEFKREMDRYIRSIKESAKAANCEEILIPGELALRTETERLKNGIPLAPATIEELAVLGESLGISLSVTSQDNY